MFNGCIKHFHVQVIPSERPGHALIEQWNPLGLIGKYMSCHAHFSFNFISALEFNYTR
jgi:hypothetical protein